MYKRQVLWVYFPHYTLIIKGVREGGNTFLSLLLHCVSPLPALLGMQKGCERKTGVWDLGCFPKAHIKLPILCCFLFPIFARPKTGTKRANKGENLVRWGKTMIFPLINPPLLQGNSRAGKG